jgi:predicted secreted protein
MRTKTILVAAFLAMFILAGTSFGGDYATLNFIGFSANGRYLAFEEYGIQDGSGFAYSNIYFIETAKNTMAAPMVRAVIENDYATEKMARSRSAALAAKKLKQFGIVRGNTGNHVVSHLINDLTFEKDPLATEVTFAEVIGSMYKQGEFDLKLRPVKIVTKDCEPYEYETFMMDLTLTNKDDNSVRTLQKDTTLPKSRGCAHGYRLQDIYLYKEAMVVFINVFTQGFEGPDMRFMAVTGKFK